LIENRFGKIEGDYKDFFYDILSNVSGDISLISDRNIKQDLEAKLACTYYYLDNKLSIDTFNNLYSRYDIDFSRELNPALTQFLAISGLIDKFLQSKLLPSKKKFFEENLDELMEIYLEMDNLDKCMEIIDNIPNNSFSNIQRIFSRILIQGMKNRWSNEQLYLKAQDQLGKTRSIEDKVILLCALGCGANALNLDYENYFQEAIFVLEKNKDLHRLACIPMLIDCMYRTGHHDIDRYVNDFFNALERRSPLELIDLPIFMCLEDMSLILWHIAHDGYYRLIEYIESVKILRPDEGRGGSWFRLDLYAGIQNIVTGIYLVSGNYNGLEAFITNNFEDNEYVRMRRKYAYYSALNKDVPLTMEKLSEWYTEYMDRRNDTDYDYYLFEILRCTENALVGLMDIERQIHRM
jgi:hypothetical protein